MNSDLMGPERERTDEDRHGDQQARRGEAAWRRAPSVVEHSGVLLIAEVVIAEVVVTVILAATTRVSVTTLERHRARPADRT